MRYLLPLLGILLVLIVACQAPVTLEKPNVSVTVKDEGATLGLSWFPVTGATGYKVYYDGNTTADTTFTATNIDISTPHKSVKVEAYNGSDVADSTISTAAADAATITVYAISDPTHYNCAFGFTSDGTPAAYDVTNTGDYTKIDYILEDRAVPLSFWSPNEYTPQYNTKINGSLAAGTDFAAVKTAPTSGTYTTKTELTVNSVYALWMGTSTNWLATDHFAKAKVESVSGTMVTLKLAYQPIGGLRWLINN